MKAAAGATPERGQVYQAPGRDSAAGRGAACAVELPPCGVSVLGSTGSIGRSALEIVRAHPAFRVVALSARENDALLAEQVREFHPLLATLEDAHAAERLQRFCRTQGLEVEVACGAEALNRAATHPQADRVVAGISGAAGMPSAFAAARAGKHIALANKEALVLAGGLLMETARKAGAHVLPADSEHNALFQCLQGIPQQEVERLILTASGGPFLHLPFEEFPQITREQALVHPTWNMGPKVTIDSATMMNKGLEIIEAHWLFGFPAEQIEALIHPQSLVHGLVRLKDGALLAHLSVPDMRLPLAHCLSWPQRIALPRTPLDLTAKALHFLPVCPKRFPCLGFAVEALRFGGGAPAVLNGANEELVARFLRGSFPFLRIASTLKEIMETLRMQLHSAEAPSWLCKVRSLADAERADAYGRTLVQEALNGS